MKRLSLMLLLLVANYTIGFSQSKEAEVTLQFIGNDRIADVNLNQDQFVGAVKTLTNFCRNDLNIDENQKIGILIVLHKQGAPTYEFYSKPELDEVKKNHILTEIKAIELENTKLVDFAFFVSINPNKNEEITNFDGYVDPILKCHRDFENADIPTKTTLLKEYAVTEVLPVLTAYEIIVEDKFEGVKNFGELIEKTDFNGTQNIEELTSKNRDYWRATMEMSVGNQIILVTKIAALISQGELDHAQKYIEITNMFSQSTTKANYYLKEISFRMTIFNAALIQQINQGIVEHDKENYQKAIKIYEEILTEYPNSALALYEKYYSENAQKYSNLEIKNTDRTDWDLAKIDIYQHDPLFHLDVRASSGREAYLMIRRQKMIEFFEDKEKHLADAFEYGQIATELGVYDFAAQLFWLSFSHDKKNSEKSLHYFLYCLDKLDEKTLKENFNIDYNKAFKLLEIEMEKDMRRSSIYRSME